ncbi:MAG: CAP domain-containing protein [Candidatus Gracilibacteria bacterium]|nr:CAP domain-containing protein [Candidatus Gracilibacteria bacterium]
MKKILLTFLIFGIYSNSFATITLKPSLITQMKQQEIVNKQAIIIQRNQANKDRLATIKAARLAKTTTNKTTTNTTTTSTASTVTPKLTPTLSPSISITTPTIASAVQTTTYNNSVKNVDLDRVRNTWLTWTNKVRSEQGLAPYTIDTRLNSTATEWSEYSKTRGYIIHGRPGDGCVGVGNYTCYNFSAIDTWFKARGIDPVIIGRAKHTENIGTRGYSCSSSDCTDKLIAAVEKTFDYFLSEKSYNGVHYKSLVNPVFTKIGVGVAVDESKGVYYLTVHYITK